MCTFLLNEIQWQKDWITEYELIKIKPPVLGLNPACTHIITCNWINGSEIVRVQPGFISKL